MVGPDMQKRLLCQNPCLQCLLVPHQPHMVRLLGWQEGAGLLQQYQPCPQDGHQLQEQGKHCLNMACTAGLSTGRRAAPARRSAPAAGAAAVCMPQKHVMCTADEGASGIVTAACAAVSVWPHDGTLTESGFGES